MLPPTWVIYAVLSTLLTIACFKTKTGRAALGVFVLIASTLLLLQIEITLQTVLLMLGLVAMTALAPAVLFPGSEVWLK
jgi:hypothetical protein